MIPDLAEKFDVVSGLSDHTTGIVVPVVATVLGAKVIEKHFILDKSIGGPDASFSLDEKEFTEMVNAVRNAEKAMGKVDYSLSEKAKRSKELCRSLYVVENMNKGDVFTVRNVRSIRPGYGMHPKYYSGILGKKASLDIEKGTPLNKEMINK
jgi:pseudaminic acid synthase